MKRALIIILKVAGALSLGGVIALGFLQRDPWLTNRVERFIANSMSQIIDVPFHMKLARLDLLSGLVSLENVHASPPTGSWDASIPRIDLSISWLSALRHGACALDVHLYEPHIMSTYDSQHWAIEEPFFAFINAPIELPIFIRSCSFERAEVRGISPAVTIAGMCHGSTIILPQSVVTKMVVDNGSLERQGRPFVQTVSGSIDIDTRREKTSVAVSTHLSGDVVTNAGALSSTMVGGYKNGEGSWTWYPTDRSLVVAAEHVHFDPTMRAHLKAEGPVSAFARFVSLSWLSKLTGAAVVSCDLETTRDDSAFAGTIALADPAYAGWGFQKGQISFKGDVHRVSGEASFGSSLQEPLLNGQWSFDVDHDRYEADVQLQQTHEFLGTKLEKGVTKGRILYDDGKLNAQYSLGVMYPSKERVIAQGSLTRVDNELHIKGIWDTAPYDFMVQLDPLKLRSGKSLYAKGPSRGKKRFEVSHAKDQGVKAKIDFDFLKEIARTFNLDKDYSLSGQAQVMTHASLSSSGNPALKIELSEGTIKIPTKHNILQSLSGTVEYDPAKRRLMVSDLDVGLYKGTVSAPTATFEFSPSGALQYAAVPLKFDNVFMSPHKGFFAHISGNIGARYLKGRWLCEGSIFLDKAQLRSNLLSSQVQNELMSTTGDWAKDVDLAVQVRTQSPLVVKTPFFQANAHIKGLINGTAAKPLVGATIEISDGSFAFPYRPLYITAGKLFLSPQQHDVLVDLTAKNTIKKYTITMHVTGSVLQPKISFDASPHVPEESILSLLASGSDGPLSNVVPTIIMSQVENILFGSEEKLTKAQQFFKGLLKPLRNVRLMPVNEEGKPIRGAIEVDINDRLRAKAQNALDLSDETQLEVEYALSDDMTVKAVRDEKGELGGELEMRWKF